MYVATSTISKWGNSQGVRIPQEILRQVPFYQDLSEVKGGKIEVDITSEFDRIIITKSKAKGKNDFSQNAQAEAVKEFLASISELPEEEKEKIPKDFAKKHRFSAKEYDKNMFKGVL
jgi:antitoxin component of MazEF toxin-antitoxin module